MRKILITILSVCILLSFSGCFELVPKEDTLETQVLDTTAVETQPTTETVTETTTQVVTKDATVYNSALKDMAWSDMTLSIDGVLYELPADYSLFVENGWSFDIAEYGYEDGFVLNPDAEVFMTIQLENEQYDNDIVVGFKNTSDEDKDVTECVVPDLQMSIHFAENYPKVFLPGLITWGSTLEDIVAVYGEDYNDEPFRSDELKYTVYEYSVNYTTSIRLVIHDERGLIDFTLKQ